tara:strand:- start:281 stop:472 length:192 start_codon:yes stop_codon:yes gene_type:complete
MLINIIVGVFLFTGGTLYIDTPYKGFSNIKALFMEEWQCEQVKTDKQKCMRVDDEYIGLFDKE